MSTYTKKTSFIGTLGAVAIAIWMVGCDEEKAPKKTLVRPAKIMTIATGGAGWQREFPAKVEASQRVDLAFNIAGTLQKISVKEGQDVKKGDVLARLNAEDLQNKLVAKQARVAAAKSDFERHQTLFEQNVGTKAELERRERHYKVETAELKIAQKSVTDSVLKAPFSGLITKRHVDNFEEVAAKMPVLSLQDLSSIVVIIDIPESIMAPVKKRSKIRAVAKFDSIPDREFELTLKEFSSEADPQTQTYRVALTMPAVEGINILPGMTASVHAEAAAVKNDQAEVMVPIAAVAADETGKHFVWKVDKSMAVKKTSVTVGGVKGDEMAVEKGLKAGDRIVVAGVNELEENQTVRELVASKEKEADR